MQISTSYISHVLVWQLLKRAPNVGCLCSGFAGTKTLDRSLTLVPDSFRLDNYRAVAYTPAYKIVLPCWQQLDLNTTRQEPPMVKQAGAPKKGRRRKKRIPGIGEYASSSKYNTATRTPATSSAAGAPSGASNSAAAPSASGQVTAGSGEAQPTPSQGSTVDLSQA